MAAMKSTAKGLSLKCSKSMTSRMGIECPMEICTKSRMVAEEPALARGRLGAAAGRWQTAGSFFVVLLKS
ncbi:UNVERIFIED_CONTAM: hypothetical protein Slati_2696400 [Sesamum latifolium]|uniref:Uncharacterized protein n=1 Tax=Sesamum latifolium TaxID=2727402 RepID=A0AAW2VYX5_9LAMI